jgi:hypothetical protein
MAQGRTASGIGQNSARNARLRLLSGLPDDPRITIGAGHALFGRASYALERRDHWGPWEHGGFFTALLPQWPRAGRKPSTDALSIAMALLVRDGLTEREAAAALAVSRDTVRPRERSPHRLRPSVERGEELLRVQESEPVGVGLRRRAGRLWDAFVALPRVLEHHEEDPDPDEDFFNPLVELLDGQQVGDSASNTSLAPR